MRKVIMLGLATFLSAADLSQVIESPDAKENPPEGLRRKMAVGKKKPVDKSTVKIVS